MKAEVMTATDLKQLVDVTTLRKGDVQLLRPMPEHKKALRIAADDPDTFRWFTSRADGDYFDAYWEAFQGKSQREDQLSFIVCFKGEVVGTTCFLAISEQHKRVEIGGTWYRADMRGSLVNPTCKLLLMKTAFAWGARRVEIKTDSRNTHSRGAILKLGAKEDGILRNHMILHDGSQRHTVYYSITPDEWPDVRAKLDARLSI